MVMGKFTVGSSWWASGQDSALPLHGLGLIPGLGKLRSYKVHSAKKKERKFSMFSGNGYRGMEKRKLVIIVHFLASLLALELSSGRSPLGRAHLKVTSVKADLEGRLELNISTVLDAFFFNVSTACAGQWGHWKLLCLQFSESLGLMPAGSIQRDVWVPEQSLSLPSYHFHARL